MIGSLNHKDAKIQKGNSLRSSAYLCASARFSHKEAQKQLISFCAFLWLHLCLFVASLKEAGGHALQIVHRTAVVVLVQH